MFSEILCRPWTSFPSSLKEVFSCKLPSLEVQPVLSHKLCIEGRGLREAMWGLPPLPAGRGARLREQNAACVERRVRGESSLERF